MHTRVRFFHSALLAISLILLLAACQPASAPTSTSAPAEPVTLRFSVLPILEALPMYVAQKENLYEKHGVKVELVPVASAPERDQLIAAGQTDGMINEALSTAFLNKDKVQAQVVRFARAATAEEPLFSILAAGNSGIESPEDLKGVEIGISEATIIEYLTDRLLQSEGFTADEIKKIAVPKIPDRLNLLGTGELKAATLPEPPVSLALLQGAKLILDDSKLPELSYSTITFRKDAIDQNPQAVSGFLAAIEEAVGLINADPAKYGDLLVEQQVVPPMLAGKFEVPPFVTAGVPSEAQWKDMISWAVEKGLLEKELPYADSVNASLLP